MKNIRILVANDPRSYREAFAEALRLIRSDAEVVEAEPKDLDREVERSKPDVVLCSSITSVVNDTARSWILLYPKNDPLVMVSTAGDLSTVSDVTLEDIVALVDSTAELISNDPARSV